MTRPGWPPEVLTPAALARMRDRAVVDRATGKVRTVHHVTRRGGEWLVWWTDETCTACGAQHPFTEATS